MKEDVAMFIIPTPTFKILLVLLRYNHLIDTDKFPSGIPRATVVKY